MAHRVILLEQPHLHETISHRSYGFFLEAECAYCGDGRGVLLGAEAGCRPGKNGEKREKEEILEFGGEVEEGGK